MKNIKIKKGASSDEKIMCLLKSYKCLPLNTISEMLDIPKSRVAKRIASLLKFQCIRRSTVTKASFYSIKKSNKKEVE